jgi:ParB/RepB/Spo0J family partition protein
VTDTTAPIATPADASPAPADAPAAKKAQRHVAVSTAPASERIESIHVSRIKVVSNVRITPFDKKALEGLAATIRQDGQLEPAQVRPLDDGSYALTFGHRRHAAVMLNEQKYGGDGMLRCVVRSDIATDDIPFVQLVENFAREDMLDYDACVVLADLQARNKLTSKQVAARIGLSDRQVRTYLTVGAAPEWLRGALNAVDIKVKVKAEDGTTRINEDGSPVTETRSLPGLSLDKVAVIAQHYKDLAGAEEQYLHVPGYKPRAEKAVRTLIQYAAAHDLSRSALSERINANKHKADDASGDNEATVLRSPKRAYSITPKAIHIDITKLATLTIADRRAMAAELHAAFAALGPDFFTAVDLKGP